MGEIVKAVYINDKGNESIHLVDDTWKWGEAFNLEGEGECTYYFEHPMYYEPNTPVEHYVFMGREALSLTLMEEGLVDVAN